MAQPNVQKNPIYTLTALAFTHFDSCPPAGHSKPPGSHILSHKYRLIHTETIKTREDVQLENSIRLWLLKRQDFVCLLLLLLRDKTGRFYQITP